MCDLEFEFRAYLLAFYQDVWKFQLPSVNWVDMPGTELRTHREEIKLLELGLHSSIFCGVDTDDWDNPDWKVGNSCDLKGKHPLIAFVAFLKAFLSHMWGEKEEGYLWIATVFWKHF